MQKLQILDKGLYKGWQVCYQPKQIIGKDYYCVEPVENPFGRQKDPSRNQRKKRVLEQPCRVGVPGFYKNRDYENEYLERKDLEHEYLNSFSLNLEKYINLEKTSEKSKALTYNKIKSVVSFEGEFQNNQIKGQGKLICKKPYWRCDPVEQEGLFIDLKLNGKGKMTRKDHSVPNGHFNRTFSTKPYIFIISIGLSSYSRSTFLLTTVRYVICIYMCPKVPLATIPPIPLLWTWEPLIMKT